MLNSTGTLQLIGVGINVHDHEGKVVACISRPYISDPAIAKPLAEWKAVELSSNLGLNNIILEGYSSEIVQALHKDESCWSSYEHVMNGVKQLLNSFHSWRVCHVKRSAKKLHID